MIILSYFLAAFMGASLAWLHLDRKHRAEMYVVLQRVSQTITKMEELVDRIRYSGGDR